MLSYTFWHWKRPGVAAETYEARQRDFQAALAAHPPQGFLRGCTVRLRGAPWAADGAVAYEDWYFVRDMSALADLNEAAVSGPRRDPHQAVAHLADGGTAGLYGLRAGSAALVPAVATWFSKPDGMSYAALDEALAPLVAAGALWMRQMVLGPTPEFCLHTAAPVQLPPIFQVQRWPLEAVWSPGS